MHLLKRDTNATAPNITAFLVQTSGVFDQHDGFWSTFNLDVGNPAQSFRVVPSTSSSQTWLPTVDGCINGTQGLIYNATTGQGGYRWFPSNCSATRGVGQFQGSQSAGWAPDNSASRPPGTVGPFAFQIDSAPNIQSLAGDWFGNLLYNATGALYPDYLQLSSDSASRINTSSRAPLLAYANRFYLLATLGLGTGFVTDSTDGGTYESPLLSLANANITPSRSWGYTAGCYSDNQRLGSLVLGGYDLARVNGTQSRFDLKPKTELQVTVSAMNFLFKNSTSPTRLAGAPFSAVIDSTLPFLELPNATLQALAGLTGLRYSSTYGLWYWSSPNDTTTRENLLASAGSLTFTLSNGTDLSVDPLVIDIPFASLYSQATTWIYNTTMNPLYILPIRNTSTNGAVLGRAFLQEAYVFVDYQRGYFNVSRTTRGTPAKPTIVSVFDEKYNVPGNVSIAVPPANTTASSSTLSSGAIAGIAVGSAVGALLILALIGALVFFFILKPRRNKKRQETLAQKEKDDEAAAAAAAVLAKSHSPDRSHRNSAWSDNSTVWGGRPHPGRTSSDPSELGGDEQDVRYRHGLADLQEIGPTDKDGAAELAGNADHQPHYPPVEMPAADITTHYARSPHPESQVSPALSGAPSPGISTYRDST